MPATKAHEITERYALYLDDASRPRDEATVRSIIAEVRLALHDARVQDRSALRVMLGSAYFRLGEYEAALSEQKHAALLDPANAYPRNNIAANLVELGRMEEALEHLREARKLSTSSRLTLAICVNEAEANHRLGRTEAARAAFEAAIANHDADCASDLFSLAMEAADLGAEDDAAEFFARYLARSQGVELGDTSAVEFICNAPKELWGRAHELPTLTDAIARVVARNDAPIPDDMQIDTRIVVSLEAWDALESALTNPPESSEALRRLMHDRRA